MRLSHAATGRRVEVQHIHVFRIQGGQVVEHWAQRDDVGQLRQLGLLPEKLGGAS